MIRLHHVPPSFTSSYVIPIPKGKGLDYSNPSNYRGIAISSVLSKLLEALILDMVSDPLNQQIHSLQGGFRKGYSSSHTSLVLQEAISNTREKGLKCFVAFLDARKAFDCVWHSGLLAKLFDYGITGNLWLLIYYWYHHLSSMVLWEGNVSRPFHVLQGVRQGALLSPLFYAIFINDLLRELSYSNIGVSIGSIYCGCPTYADDMTLLSDSQNDLQYMLNIVGRYAFKWGYTFNYSKSKILVFGESSRSRRVAREQRTWYLNGTPLSEADSIKHLGIVLSVSSSALEHINSC